jgi:choline-sulfatase
MLPVILAVSAAAIATAVVLRKPAPANLLLISVDTLRPDHLGCYGYGPARTPNIDRLAAEGFVFDDAITSMPLTLPSHTSMLTGLSPLSHGVRDNSNFRLADDFVTMAEVLQAKGYDTGAVIAAYVLDSSFGLAQGFSAYDDNLTRGKTMSTFSYPERPANEVTDSAVRWLQKARRPFLLFAHYYDPHAPYAPPAPYREMMSGRPYDGEIAFADQEIGRLLDFLRERKLLARTLVILVSDHGEGFGEHGEETHGILLYQGTLKVAFIVRPPEGARFAGKRPAGRRSAEPVMLVDLVPTALEMLGIKDEVKVDGRSLVPLLEGRSLPPRVCYFETLSAYFAYRWSPLRGVLFNQWKYTYAPEEELYNLSDDPAEAHNLAAADGEKTAEMKAALRQVAREEPRSQMSQAPISPEAAQRLRALGYVSASPVAVPDLEDLTLKDPKKMVGLVVKYLEPGNTAFDNGDLALALRLYGEFVQADPTNPDAQIHLARVLLEMRDYPKAVAAYNRVLELDPANSGAVFHLGNIAQAMGKPDDALAFYERALELEPGSPEAYANIGTVLLEKGLPDSAIAVLHKALAASPRTTTALLNLGLAYVGLNLPDSALVYFKRLLAVDSENAKGLANCAAIYLVRGEIDSAMTYFERARQVQPDDPRTLVNLGGVYRQKGFLDKAADCYQTAVRLEPHDLLALYGLAGVRLSQGRRDEAAALIEQILQIDPGFKPAIEAARHLGLR